MFFEVLTPIKTAIGKMVIEKGDPAKVDEALLESRRVFNEVLIRLLDNEKVSDKDIRSFLVDNTKQRIIAKAKETFKSFKELKEKGEAEELRTYEKPLPLRMNFGEGYNLWIEDDRIAFRVTLIPRKEYIKGYLEFSKEQEEIVRKAIEEKGEAIKLRKHGIDYTPEYDVTIAELVKRKGEYYLHITITRNVPVSSIRCAAGIDVNEDNVTVTVYDLIARKVVDSFIVDYVVIKFMRHWFTIRKRLQEHGARSKKKLEFTEKESRQIEYLLHFVSRRIVDYLSKYQLIVFMEDLDGIRNGNGSKGKRMNKRLHSWPFRKLQSFLRYKLEWLGIPAMFVPPENTSRRCPLCGKFGIRHKKLFRCPNGHIGHADRNASVNVLIRGCVMHLHVPYSAFRSISMRLPNFRMWKLRRNESGAWGIVNMPIPAGVEPFTAAQRQEAEKLRFQREEATS